MSGGAGVSAAGRVQAGYHTIDSAAAPLAPTAAATRLVDPLARDYSRDSSGAFLPATKALQRVLLALMTRLGSSSEASGMGILAPGAITGTFDADVRAAVDAALAPLGADISIASVDVNHSTHPPAVTVQFWANGELQAVTV